MTPGLPPQSPETFFIGYDAMGNPYILHWQEGQGCYIASGLRPNQPTMIPWNVVIKGANANFIAGYDEVPS